MTARHGPGIELQGRNFQAFQRANPRFDLRDYDLFSKRSVTGLNWVDGNEGSLLQELRKLQRLLRLGADEAVANALISKGYLSAHHIAAFAEHQFVRDSAGIFGGDEMRARAVYRRAVHVKEGLKHVRAWVNDALASPHYRALRSTYRHPEIVAFFQESVPSYQELFGSLDYLACAECDSILGPAAYFLDLMRITDQYITDPNSVGPDKIPPHYKLEERRPDLFDLDLTCANTLTVIPYLEIVNGILAKQVETLLKVDDAYKVLAVSRYPVNLPFNLPLAQTRANLEQLAVPLAKVFHDLRASAGTKGVATLDVAREQLALSVDELQVITTSDADPASLARRYGYVDPSARIIDFAGAGKVSAAKDGLELVGKETLFLSQLRAGDRVELADETRIVKTVESDTLLTVDTKWAAPQVEAVYRVLPQEALLWAREFLARTGLTSDELRELLIEQLDVDELKEGVGRELFINATGESLPAMAELFDSSDAPAPAARITGLSYQRLDRLDRFLRLQRALRWSYADVDWAVRRSGENPSQELTAKLVENLATMEALRTQTKVDIDLLSGLWSDLKTIGRVVPAAPRDAFDRVYNNPALLAGANPYKKGSTIPFDPGREPAQRWLVAGKSDADMQIRSRLAAALALRDADLTTIANYVLRLESKVKVLDLNLPTLSSLYRLAMLARLSGLGVHGCLTLLCLMYYPEAPYLEPPPAKVPRTLDSVRSILDSAAWLTQAELDVFQLKYSLTEEGSPYFEPSYESDEIKAFVNSLAALGADSLLGTAALTFDDFTDQDAQKLFAELVTLKVVTKIGVLTAKGEDDFASAELFPLKDTAFVSTIISKEDSRLAFAALEAHEPPLIESTGPKTGVLTDDFNDETSLAFLDEIFKGPKAKPQISQVRSRLLQCRSHIDQTAQALADAADAQHAVVDDGLGSFIDVDAELITAVLPLAASKAALADYLAALLTPVPKKGALPPKLEDFIADVSRFATLAETLSLTPSVLGAVIEGPHHFNIASPESLTLANARSLFDYNALAAALHVRKDGLLEYFTLPKDAAPCPGSKVKRLAKLTGWDAAEICELIKYFWPEDGRSLKADDYDTVRGLERMRACFDDANGLRLDMAGLLALAGLSALALEKAGKFDEEAWVTFRRSASRALDSLGARFGADEFKTVHRVVVDAINGSARDHLLGFTLWLMRQHDLPSLESPQDLYQYLLIDVEMGACMDTSKIAQGIASVQLYMQRCRMMQEPGVTDLRVKSVWWSWLTNYRIWDANRRIFLYPENYIDPTLRSTASPLFKALSSNLGQEPITKASAGRPLEDYLQDLDVLANLQHCAACRATVTDPDSKERTSRLYLFAKTLTSPTTFYYRTYDELLSWSPWQQIDINVSTNLITPVYAFNRLFIFWLEGDQGQSASIEEKGSQTETIKKSSLKYSFFTPSGAWVQPQLVSLNEVAKAFPGNYPSLDTSELQDLLNPDNLAWTMAYGLSSGAGFVGAGRVTIAAGISSVIGTETQFDREVRDGDEIWCEGEFRTVGAVAGTDLVVTEAWTSDIKDSQYRIVPKRQRARLEPFVGPGKVTVTSVTPTVFGKDTRFKATFNSGDKIAIGDETQIVNTVISDTQLLTTSKWRPVSDSAYTAIPTKSAAERLIVFLGSPLTTSYGGAVAKPPDCKNPGMNLFLAQRNEFNLSMFEALNTARLNRDEQTEGLVTLGPAYVFDENLFSTPVRLTLADYQYSAAATPQPYRAVLDRAQEHLTVTKSRNATAANYWDDSVAGVDDTLPVISQSGGLDLLYYISEQRASLLNVTNQPGWFIFNNSDEAFLVQSQEKGLNKLSEMLFISSKPLPGVPGNVLISAGAHTSTPESFDALKFKFDRISTATVSQMSRRLFAGGVDNLLTVESQSLPELPFARFYPAPGHVPPKSTIPPDSDRLDFNAAFGLYFEEIFFHAPFLISQLLRANRRFDDSKTWLEYVFNPTQEPGPDEPGDARRFWRYLPFRKLDQQSLLTILTNEKQLKAYADHPFDPDVIAKLRPVAYAKAVVMRYVDNLLDWGDMLFTQDTRETINEATNLYVLASELLGPRPQPVGSKPKPKALNFSQIRKYYPGGIPPFVIDLENSEFSSWDAQGVVLDDVPVNDLPSYFCVPENADLTAYWDRVEDRLFKIRHCMNIAGVVRSLALFEPPIDPRTVIRALAAGGGLPSLAAQLRPAIPYYRFDYMLDKAKEFAGTLQGYASSVQSAYESRAAEAGDLLRVRQEKQLLELTTLTLEQAVEEAKASLKSLSTSLASATWRNKKNKEWRGNGGADYLNGNEKEQLRSMKAAAAMQIVAGVASTIASINYSLPDVGSPFALKYGGIQLGNTLTAVAGALDFAANVSSIVGDVAGVNAGYDRRNNDWDLEIKLSAYEMQQLGFEITAADTRLKVAERQLAIHLKTIKQNEETEKYLRDKFSNVELYQWISNRMATLYFQLYTVSFDLALVAQQAFQYEYNTNQTFLEFGYWNDRAAGLTAADGLYLALLQMDKARVSRPSRSLEINRRVSLAELDGLQLLNLKRDGQCTIRLSEQLFDLDFPGHYARRIKTVAVTIVAGDDEDPAFQNVAGTLVQVSNFIVARSDAAGLNAVGFLLGDEQATTPDASALRSNWWNNQQIALSTGVDDSGLFEVDLLSNGYLPFEGTGAVSTWTLSLPRATNRFDFDLIADVTLAVQYTALDGGEKFRRDVEKCARLLPYAASGFFDMVLAFPDEWEKFMEPPESAKNQVLKYSLESFVPANVTRAIVSVVYLALSATGSAPGTYIKLRVTDDLVLDVEMDKNNFYSYNFKEHGVEEPNVKDVLGARTITFDLANTPTSLKSGGVLDPNKLRDMQLSFEYQAEVKLARPQRSSKHLLKE